MTIRYIVKCDLCGKEHEIGWSRELTTEARQFEKPDGWQMLKYTVKTNPETGVTFQMNLMICPVCDKAIREGETVVSAYLSGMTAGQTIITTNQMPKVEVIDLSDRPTVSEEEANL